MAEAKDVTPIRLLVAITLVAVAIAATGCLTGDSGSGDGPPVEAGDSGGGSDPNPAGADPATPAPQAEPIITVTETVPTNQELKLLKKIGPIEFPPYGAKIDEVTPVTQRTEFEFEGYFIAAGAGSSREVNLFLQPARGSVPEKDIVVLLLVRDAQGNIEKSLCKEDEETGNYYFLKKSLSKFGLYNRDQAVSQREYNLKKESLHSWEVLVYVRE
jgi:hypothetical protein